MLPKKYFGIKRESRQGKKNKISKLKTTTTRKAYSCSSQALESL